jgi:hypothetical protein
VKAAIRHLHSPDVSDLAGCQPDDPTMFDVLL